MELEHLPPQHQQALKESGLLDVLSNIDMSKLPAILAWIKQGIDLFGSPAPPTGNGNGGLPPVEVK